jgi:hypothetical protein
MGGKSEVRMKMVIDLKANKVLADMPHGLVGQISFSRLIAELQRSGEIRRGETITHLDIQVDRGVILYRVEEVE